MTQLVTGELEAYRTRPQRSDLKLVIYKPQVIMAARVWDAIVQDHDVLIPYVNVTEGVYTSVRPGMTMYVGTTPGSADLGRVRVRDFASDVLLTIARNSIRWSLAPYITIVDFYEIWPMYIQEIQSGTHTDHFKDWDEGYLGQNYYMGTLLSVGSHAICHAGESVYWSSSGTVQTQESALSYSWVFGGGVSGSSSSANPGWVQYNIPGNYTTRVTALVTGTSQEDITYRHVVVLGDDIQPYTQFEFDSIDGTRDEGGWRTKITLREADYDAVLDGSLVMIYRDDHYGDAHQSYGNNSTNRTHMLFVGYVIDNSIAFDYQDSIMEFEVSSPTGRMKLADSSSMEVDSVLVPTNWYQIPYLNGKKALYHYLRWHTTVLNCCDIRWIADDRPLRYVQGEISSMYDLVNKMLDKYILCEFVSDRLGLLWVENDPKSVHDKDTHYATVLTLDRQDRAGEVTFDEIAPKKLSYLESGGLAYGGITGSIVNDVMLTGSFTTVLSGAPGNNLRDYFGRAEVIQGYYINSQAENNTLVGDMFAHMNATFPAVNIDMSGWYAAVDIAPEEIVKLTLNQNDTRRGFVWRNKPFLIRELSIEHKMNMLRPSLNLHEVTYGVAGETVPVLPPPSYNTPYGPTLPPFNPEWPIIPFPTPNPPHIPFTVEECWTNLYAPANGPYTSTLGITVQTYGGVISYDIPYPCILRDGDAINPTSIQLDYTAYTAATETPGIGDWTENADQVGLIIEALNGSGAVVATAVSTLYSGPAAGIRTFTFYPASPVAVASFRITADRASGEAVGDTTITLALTGAVGWDTTVYTSYNDPMPYYYTGTSGDLRVGLTDPIPYNYPAAGFTVQMVAGENSALFPYVLVSTATEVQFSAHFGKWVEPNSSEVQVTVHVMGGIPGSPSYLLGNTSLVDSLTTPFPNPNNTDIVKSIPISSGYAGWEVRSIIFEFYFSINPGSGWKGDSEVYCGLTTLELLSAVIQALQPTKSVISTITFNNICLV